MDVAQILLISVVTILTLLLVVLGVQVFFILQQFKHTVGKVNKVLDDAGVLTESIATPVANLSTVIGGIKTGVSLLSMLKTKKKKHFSVEEEEDASRS